MARAGRKSTSSPRPDYIKWALVAGAAIIVVLVGFLARRYWWHPTVNVDKYPIKGIDVSGHNSITDWNAVAQSGITFVYIKASEGASYTNPHFHHQYTGARKAGLMVGCYHFFRKNRDGVAQASHFIASVARLQLDLPLVVDVEDWNGDRGIDEATTRRRLTDMVSTLERHGFKVMIYTNGDGHKAYYLPALDGHDLWLSSFNEPEKMQHVGHRIQQYSHWGTIDGVEGDVDLNVFMGSKQEWNQWLDSLQLNP